MSLKESTIEKYIVVALLAVVLFKVVASVFPMMTEAGTELNDSGMPFGEFFTDGGIIWIIFAAGLLLLAYRTFMTSGKKK